MAKFTSSVPLNIRWLGNELAGPAGTVHRIPDALYEEFDAAFGGLIPGLTWTDTNEIDAFATLPIAQADVTGLTAALAAKVATAGGTVTGTLNVADLQVKGGPWYDVTAYGAVGDGVTDDTSAIQSAVTALGGRGIIFFPSGSYLVTSPITWGASGQRFVGAGADSITREASVIVGSLSAGFIFQAPNTTDRYFGIAFESLGVVNSSTNTAAGGIDFSQVSESRISSCVIRGSALTSKMGTAVKMHGPVYYTVIHGVRIGYANIGVSLASGPTFGGPGNNPNANVISQSQIAGCNRGVSIVNAAVGNQVIGSQIDAVVDYGVFIGGTAGRNAVAFCYIEGASATATNVHIDVAACQKNHVFGNAHAGNGLLLTDNGTSTIVYDMVANAKHMTSAEDVPSPGVIAFSSISVSITSSSATALPFDSETAEYINASFHENSTNNSRITIPAGLGGDYEVGTSIRWESNSTGYRQVYIRKNGTLPLVGSIQPAVVGQVTDQNVSKTVRLVAGDYLEVIVLQTSGTTLAVLYQSGLTPEFWARRTGA